MVAPGAPRRLRSHLLLALGAAALLTPPLSARAADDFDELVDLAANQESSPRGAGYLTALRGAFDAEYGERARDCIESDGAGGLSSYRFVLRIGAGGNVLLLVVDPPGGTESCLRELLEGSAFPPPPFAPFHALLRVTRGAPGAGESQTQGSQR